MIKYWIGLLFFPITVLSQNFLFNQEYDSITVQSGNYQVPVPWTGGYSFSVPAFCDIDGDGKLDLFLGKFQGNLAYFQNTGNPGNPFFRLVNENFQNIQGPGYSVPCFADIDNDGDYDLFCDFGNEYMHFYRNIGTIYSPQFVLETDSLRDTSGDLIDGSGFDLCDINGDGLLDLFVQQWYTGNIYYYQNVGTPTQFSFSLVSTNFAGVSTGDWCHPKFCDIDGDGDYDLFIGDHYGHIWFYRNIGTPSQYNFTLVSNNWLGIDVGDDACPTFCDIDSDGDYDLFIGKENDLTFNIPGALHYWQNMGTPQSPNFVQVTQSYLTFDAGSSTIVHFCDIDHDGDQDLFFMTNANLGWMKNVGTPQTPAFQVQSFNLLTLPPGTFTFAHLDSDVYPDLITEGGWTGIIYYWRTTWHGGQLSFQSLGSMNTGLAPGISSITAGDLDGDGRDELLLGGFDYNPSDVVLSLYKNQGTPGNPNFVLQTENYLNLLDSLGIHSSYNDPILSDVDQDGKLDLLFSPEMGTNIHYYHNIGTLQQPQFTFVSSNLFGMTFNEGIYSDDGCDIDADGDWDAFLGTYSGGIRFLRNVTGESPVHPNPKRPIGPPERQITILPNPGNSGTTIIYVLSHPQHVNLSVYNILGSRLATLVEGLQQPGSHVTSWDATWRASGIYLIRMESLDFTATQKVVIAK